MRNEDDILIAEFLDWFQEDDQRETWYVNGQSAIYVAYSTYKSPTNDLPFSHSWDSLFPVITKINSLGKGVTFMITKTYCSCSIEKSNKFHKDFSYAHSVVFDPTKKNYELKAVYELVVHFLKYYKQNKS